MINITSAIASGKWFPELPHPIQKAVLAMGNVVRLETGQTSFVQGNAPTGIHCVISGQLRISHVDRHGHEVLMALVRPGEWTGFLCALDGKDHFYSAVAAEPCAIFRLNYPAVQAIFETDVATYKLLEAPELNVARALARFAIAEVGRPLARRVAARLCDLGRWAYGPNSGPVAALDHVTQEDLAMSTHASRQSINTILRDFEARGWISIGYGRVDVIDIVSLEWFADNDQ